MKKILLILITIMAFCPKSYANSDNIALLTKNGFFEKPQVSSTKPCDDVKKILFAHLKYSNEYNFDKLNSLYATNYINADGLSKDVLFDLIKKTWANYPDIKYKIAIENIQIGENSAIAQLSEEALATTNATSQILAEKGILKSFSSSIYYLTKINNEWKITSDHVIFEKTFLTYGSAQNVGVELIAPSQIAANTPYTATLRIDAPKDALIIASIGKENITYPQDVAEEVFRKLPDSGTLERVFKSNKDNINEYTVASFGLTRAEVNNGSQIKISVTGLGFAMSRVNVVPINNFVKFENEKTDKVEKKEKVDKGEKIEKGK